MDLRRLLLVPAVSLVVLSGPLGAMGGGRTTMCERRLHGDLEPGEYQVTVVARDHRDLISELVEQATAELKDVQPLRFANARFRFVVSESVGPLVNLDRGAAIHRAYIVLSYTDANEIAKGLGPTDVVTTIPPIDKAEIVSALEKNPISADEYYQRMALHSTLHTLLYWTHSHRDRVMEISFGHMMTNPE